MKKKKRSKATPKKKAWGAFSKWIRLRDALETTGTPDTLICCSCGKPYPAFGVGCAQAGHFIPGRGQSILFEENCVHGQCYNCNIRLKGNWPGYYAFMLKKYGQHAVNALLILNKQTRKRYESDYVELREKYDGLYEQLKEGGA